MFVKMICNSNIENLKKNEYTMKLGFLFILFIKYYTPFQDNILN